MKSLTLLAAVCCICVIQAVQVQQRSGQPEGLSEYESFTSALNDNNNNNNKNLRPLQDIRTVQASPLTSTKRVLPSRSNIVYGKGRYAEQPKFTRHHYHPTTQKPKLASPVKNFKPSPEDSFEVDNQYAQNFKLNNPDSAVLQKYMEKYAQQLYAAQKHAAQLSESQKYVLGQDPYAKKFTTQPQAKYSAPKFIPLSSSSESKATSSSSITKYPEESFESGDAVTEKFPSYSVSQKLTVTPKGTAGKSVVPKKAYSYSWDNTPQSTDYKYSNLYGNALEPQLVNQYLTTYGSEDRESLAGYEQAYAAQYGAQFGGQYGGSVGITDKAEIPKITGYKIPGAVSLSLGHAHQEEKGHKEPHHHEHEEHHPHADPKYEFMYQVKDPEKHNHFGHSEARKGKTTWGKYFVQLPDGRLETVKYWADKTGYHAEVDFKGQAKHPSHKEYSQKEHSHGHYHHGLERLEEASGVLGTSYVGQSGLISQAGLSSHQEYSTAEQAEEYQ